MWILACVTPTVEKTDTPVPDSPADTDTKVPALDCDALPAPELVETFRGLETSEDFALSADGWLVHVTDQEDLVREDSTGTLELLVPSVGTIAGTAFLPDGDLAIANVLTGSVERLGLDGSRVVLASGLGYPNGLAVGADGYVYVADQTAGRVHRIAADGATIETVAEGLNNPNGVAFGPGGALYVGSFGGGVVYRIVSEGDGFALPEMYAGRDGAFAVNTDPCVTGAVGDACFRIGSLGPGVCAEGAGGLTCMAAPDIDACAALAEGEACATELLGAPISSVCTASEDGAFCPGLDAGRISACDGVALYGSCTYDESAGYCAYSFEGVLACETYEEASDAYMLDCAARVEGDACQLLDPLRPDAGLCTDGSVWGYDRLLCLPATYTAFGMEQGGFDAIGVDACGQLYVGEYLSGTLLRWPEGGESPEEVVTFDSAWIPNLHWGNGTDVWATDHIYVMNRDGRGGVFAVALGVGDGALSGSP